jgi:hypothetical protein
METSLGRTLASYLIIFEHDVAATAQSQSDWAARLLALRLRRTPPAGHSHQRQKALETPELLSFSVAKIY